jgi:hypothetical protein
VQEINISQTQGNKNTYAQVTTKGTHNKDQDKKQDVIPGQTLQLIGQIRQSGATYQEFRRTLNEN